MSTLKAISLALVCVSLSACQLPVVAHAQLPFHVVDTMTDFFRRADAAPQTEAGLAEAFRGYIAAHRDVLSANVLRVEPGALDAELEKRAHVLAKEYPAIAPTMRQLYTRLLAHLDEGTAKFMRAFPAFPFHGNCYFVASFQGFNGARRNVSGHPALLWGIDVLHAR